MRCRVVEILGGGFYRDSNLPDAPSCRGDGRKILDHQQAFGGDGVLSPIRSLAGELDIKRITCVEDEIILHRAGGNRRAMLRQCVQTGFEGFAWHTEQIISELVQERIASIGIQGFQRGKCESVVLWYRFL